jgi:dihydrofolate reductase
MWTQEQADRVHHFGEFGQTLEDFLKASQAFVIGGAQIYNQFLPFADVLYITELDVELTGDAFFPEIDPSMWKLIAQESYKADERNQYDYKFLTYKRI